MLLKLFLLFASGVCFSELPPGGNIFVWKLIVKAFMAYLFIFGYLLSPNSGIITSLIHEH